MILLIATYSYSIIDWSFSCSTSNVCVTFGIIQSLYATWHNNCNTLKRTKFSRWNLHYLITDVICGYIRSISHDFQTFYQAFLLMSVGGNWASMHSSIDRQSIFKQDFEHLILTCCKKIYPCTIFQIVGHAQISLTNCMTSCCQIHGFSFSLALYNLWIRFCLFPSTANVNNILLILLELSRSFELSA
jgi:hypothetical protein